MQRSPACVAPHSDEALAHGVEFLRKQQGADGRWRDFHTEAGTSTEWVTAFVLTQLAELPQCAHMRAAAAQALVRWQRGNGGWSYNPLIPPDGDSTAWALRALQGQKLLPPRTLRKGLHFLARHEIADTGGFTTYTLLKNIQHAIGEANLAAVRGWGSAHSCVTANAALALMDQGLAPTHPLLTRALSYLSNARDANGLWQSYWWQGYGYGTYHATLALSRGGRLSAAARSDIARTLLRHAATEKSWTPTVSPQADIFPSVWVLSMLLMAVTDAQLRSIAARGVEWLTQQQRADGSWNCAAILRIPPADVQDPAQVRHWHVRNDTGVAIIVHDINRVFTTAAVLRVLERARRVLD
jgi:squalene cyclase